MKRQPWLYTAPRIDLGLLFLRLAGSFMLLYVHGIPKILHYANQLAQIEDPFGLGRSLSLWAAIFAEVLCPIAIVLGVATRLACLPIIAVLLIAMLAVHPDWSVAEGQFGWLLLIIFITISLCGAGRWGLLPSGTKETP
ncbi:DoxX family protein [Acerihabitans sp. TG2]|uniref:DoxX family protein n=1 Tax=Acerihabitans sp. TG2 TaxID=3096008 RepID=UPI002B22EB83|nr:DoxX family protein [Acerihabitans sp. TG2]MEA9389933.1 DoxX family protein [Acerihabitans sp. TG2]